MPFSSVGSLALASTAIDLFAFKLAAEQWAREPDGPQQVAAFWSVEAVHRVNTAFTAIWILVLLGVTPPLLGFLIKRLGGAVRLAGGLGLVGGLMCIAASFST